MRRPLVLYASVAVISALLGIVAMWPEPVAPVPDVSLPPAMAPAVASPAPTSNLPPATPAAAEAAPAAPPPPAPPTDNGPAAYAHNVAARLPQATIEVAAKLRLRGDDIQDLEGLRNIARAQIEGVLGKLRRGEMDDRAAKAKVDAAVTTFANRVADLLDDDDAADVVEAAIRGDGDP